jgi:hypothetical protein
METIFAMIFEVIFTFILSHPGAYIRYLLSGKKKPFTYYLTNWVLNVLISICLFLILYFIFYRIFGNE